jgi:signal transduction histidine kinase
MSDDQKSVGAATTVELADILFSSSAPILGNWLITLIGGAALLYERYSPFILLWTIANSVVCVVRLRQWRSYRRQRQSMTDPQAWMRRNARLVVATGILWGMLGLVTVSGTDMMNSVMVPLMIFSISASIASTHSCYVPAVRAFIFPAYFLTGLGEIIGGDAPHLVIALCTLIYLANLELVARRGHRVVVQTLLSRFAKERSQEQLARAQRVAATGSTEYDLATGVEECSEEMYHLLGIAGPRSFSLTEEENILAAIHPQDRERVRAMRVVQRAGHRTRPGEFRVVRPDGEVKTLYAETDIQRDSAGRPLRVLTIVKDVTALRAAEQRQKEMQQQLLQAQKLEAMGTLAGGVAHELNNTLVPVLALAKLTIKRLPEGSREQNNLITILQAGEKARDLVARVVAFSRKEMPTRVEVDLATLTRDTLSLMRHSLPATIQLAERIEPVPPILGDPGQLPQIIINLVMNAVQATPERTGTVTVEVAPAQGEKLLQMPERAPGVAVRLSVIDRGGGMDKATRARVFEPFFTTKTVGDGVGLGLSVVHGIVTQHGGNIAVESSPGRGTRFDVYLPAAPITAVAPPATAETAAA